MNKQELIREVAIRTGYIQKVCDEVINEMIEVMIGELEAHGTVRIPKFGIFKVYNKKPKNVRIPDTKQIITTEKKKYPKFTPAKELKSRVDSLIIGEILPSRLLYGRVVKWLRHCPFTAGSRVRVSTRSPRSISVSYTHLRAHET